MKDCTEIGELCAHTLVKEGMHYAIVMGDVSYVYYRYLGVESDLLDMGYTVQDIGDAVEVMDFSKYVWETSSRK